MAMPLLERLYAALWQMYMFYGYADADAEFDAVITLSLKTGLIYSVFLAVNFIISFVCYKKAKFFGASSTTTFSKLAMYFTLSVGIVYWLLGISILNNWRP